MRLLPEGLKTRGRGAAGDGVSCLLIPPLYAVFLPSLYLRRPAARTHYPATPNQHILPRCDTSTTIFYRRLCLPPSPPARAATFFPHTALPAATFRMPPSLLPKRCYHSSPLLPEYTARTPSYQRFCRHLSLSSLSFASYLRCPTYTYHPRCSAIS